MSPVLEMILPDRRIENRRLGSVVFQSADGELGILGGHALLVCEVRAGTLCAVHRHLISGNAL